MDNFNFDIFTFGYFVSEVRTFLPIICQDLFKTFHCEFCLKLIIKTVLRNLLYSMKIFRSKKKIIIIIIYKSIRLPTVDLIISCKLYTHRYVDRNV